MKQGSTEWFQGWLDANQAGPRHPLLVEWVEGGYQLRAHRYVLHTAAYSGDVGTRFRFMAVCDSGACRYIVSG